MSVAPGLAFEVAPPLTEPSPLRSDVAGFVGATRRGPVGEVVRVEEWRDYERVFGGLAAAADTTYAIRSYFENGGAIAYVVRTGGASVFARGDWPLTEVELGLGGGAPGGAAAMQAFFLGDAVVTQFEVQAATPGAWANDGTVVIDYRSRGRRGGPEIDVVTHVPGEIPEMLRGLPAHDAGAVAAAIAERSRLVRLDVASRGTAPPAPGPSRWRWRVTLRGGADAVPDRAEYLEAVAAISRERRVALLALPDLHRHLGGGGQAPGLPESRDDHAVLRAAVTEAEQRHDRLVLIDLPFDRAAPYRPVGLRGVTAILDELDTVFLGTERRAAAVYHPALRVSDPLGSVAQPERLVPPSGAVAGLISRLDRQRGAHHTPANAPLFDAVDGAEGFDATDRAVLNERGLNLIQCRPNRGLSVWGGRTLAREYAYRFVAHRRLVHRLVRVIRRVAEPLVFDENGPELRFALVRAISSVLLAAFRAGALKGAAPDEGFRVQCDAENNPPDEEALGRVLCDIEIAPAVPMEFITLRVALGREGMLEVLDR